MDLHFNSSHESGNPRVQFDPKNKMTQSGTFFTRYQTGMTDAGMPMPALVFRMPMPTYGFRFQNSDSVEVSKYFLNLYFDCLLEF
jgi:hypothetical protein